MTPAKRQERRRRSDGEESYRRIRDAATEVAAQRGYDGTSIALVSAASGLPASSIYHHFRDKDELISAVIEHSFTRWRAAIDLPELSAVDANERVMALGEAAAKALLDTPEFLRLGLMLALERRPEEPSARRMFLDVRQTGFQVVVDTVSSLLPDADPHAVSALATYALAGADGLFIAHEIGGDSVDLLEMFSLHARAILSLAATLDAETSRPPRLRHTTTRTRKATPRQTAAE